VQATAVLPSSAGSRLASALIRVGCLAVTGGLTLLGGAAPASAAPVRADRVRETQWQLTDLRASEAWKVSTGAGVIVAVIDSGVDDTHPDLAGQVLDGTDLVSAGGDGHNDVVGHGTTVAGLIAGRADDRRGIEGLAPEAKILPVRVLDARNRYDDARVVANGVRWAVDHGADVINLSLGGAVTSPALADAIDYAFEKDVVVVACTGNEAPPAANEVWYPAREPGVLAVTGLDHRISGPDPLWGGSITGNATVLAAPANDLTGARPGGYWEVEGTSFAAPLVSATAALIRSRWPDMSAANVVNRLIQTADDLGTPGRDKKYGYGRVDPVAALTDDVVWVPTNPLDNAPPPGKAKFSRAVGAPEATHPPAPVNRGRDLASVFAPIPAGLAVVFFFVGRAARRRRDQGYFR
jgi:type VII secretion-associated serine protease mycosin